MIILLVWKFKQIRVKKTKRLLVKLRSPISTLDIRIKDNLLTRLHTQLPTSKLLTSNTHSLTWTRKWKTTFEKHISNSATIKLNIKRQIRQLLLIRLKLIQSSERTAKRHKRNANRRWGLRISLLGKMYHNINRWQRKTFQCIIQQRQSRTFSNLNRMGKSSDNHTFSLEVILHLLDKLRIRV